MSIYTPFKVKTNKGLFFNTYSIEYTSPLTDETIHYMNAMGKYDHAEYLASSLNRAYNQGMINSIITNRKHR